MLLAIRGRLAEGKLPPEERARLEVFLADDSKIAEAYRLRRPAAEPAGLAIHGRIAADVALATPNAPLLALRGSRSLPKRPKRGVEGRLLARFGLFGSFGSPGGREKRGRNSKAGSEVARRVAWGAASREEFHRIVFSGWGLLSALLFVTSPLVMAYYVAQGFNGDGPTPLHQGARFAYFSYPLTGFGALASDALLPVVILIACVVGPSRPGGLAGRLAAFGVLAAAAWLAPVVLLGLTFVGPTILAPGALAFGVLLLELAPWVALGTLASQSRRISPPLAAMSILATFAFVYVVTSLILSALAVSGGGFSGFERQEVWRMALTAATPTTAAATLRSLLFPGNGGTTTFFEARSIEPPALLVSTWTWAVVLLAWAAVLLLLARRIERRAAEDGPPQGQV